MMDHYIIRVYCASRLGLASGKGYKERDYLTYKTFQYGIMMYTHKIIIKKMVTRFENEWCQK